MRDFHAAEKRRFAAEKKAGRKPRPTRLKEADFVFVIDLTEFMQGRLECFRSASMLARACGYSESAADAGLRRLVAAGFLEKLPPAEGDTNGKGRPASRYRVPAIFPVLEREKSEVFSTSQEGEKTGDEKAFSTAGQVILSTSPEGNDQRDDQKGAKAPTAPLPPSSSDTDVVLIERCGSVAHERDHPPLPSEGPLEGDEPILDPIDRDLPEIPDDVADRFRQEDEALPPPETEADPEDLDDDLWLTDDLMTEPSEDGAFTAAIRDLRALHGADILDLEAFALDFTDGFLWSDFKARERAARCITKVLLQAGADARAIWADHVKILKRLAIGNGQSHDAALETMANYHSAVAAAADAIKSERRRRMFDHSEEGATNHV